MFWRGCLAKVALVSLACLVVVVAVLASRTTAEAQLTPSCPVSADLSPRQGQPAVVSGQLSTSDCTWPRAYMDRYRLHVGQAASVTIDLTSSRLDTWLSLSDANGAHIVSDDDGGAGLNSQISRVLDAGTYYVDASTYDTASTGAYELRVSLGGSTTSGATTRTCAMIDIAVPHDGDGVLSSDDCRDPYDSDDYADIYRFRLERDARVVINLSSGAFDAHVRVLDDSGNEIVEDDDGGQGLNSRLEQNLRTGTYQIVVTERNNGRGTGAYELRVRADGATSTSSQGRCEIAGLLRLTGASTSGTGEWVSSDCRSDYTGRVYSDRWRLEVARGAWVTIDLTSSSTDTFLTLLGEDGQSIEDDDDGGQGVDSRITRQLDAGTYYLEASTYRGRATGSYEIHVSMAQVAQCGASHEIRVPIAHSGVLASDDCRDPHDPNDYADIYRFELDAESRVIIDLTSGSFDTYLRLLDDRGAEITRDDDSGTGLNSQITRALQPGVYQIVATSYRADVGAYDLRVSTGELVGATCPATDLGTIERRVTVIGAGWTANDCVSSRAETTGSREDLYTFRLSRAGSVQIVLLFESGPTWVWLTDEAGDSRFGSGDPITVAGMPKGTVITSQRLAGGMSYTISATTPEGSGAHLGSYSLQIVPEERPTAVDEEFMKHRLAVELLERNVNGTYVAVEAHGTINDERGTNHDYNDWGCPFIGVCGLTDEQRSRYGVGGTTTYTRFNYHLYRSSDGRRVQKDCGYVGGHGGWDIQTRTATGGREPDVRFRSLTSGILTRVDSSGQSVNTIAVYDGVRTAVYLHGEPLDGREVGDLVHVGEVLARQSDVGSRGSTHVHIEVRDGQRRGGGCGADSAPDRPRQLGAGERTMYPIRYLYDAIAGVERVTSD